MRTLHVVVMYCFIIIVVMHFSVYIVHSTVMNHGLNMYTLSVLHVVVMQVVLLVYLML